MSENDKPIFLLEVGDHATNMPSTVWFGGSNAIKDSIKYKYDSCGNISQITENGHLAAKSTPTTV